MRSLTLALAGLVLAGAAPAVAQEPTPTPTSTPAPAVPALQPVLKVRVLRNGCSRLYTQKHQAIYARKVFHRAAVTERARRRLAQMRRCAHSGKAARNMRRVQRGKARARRLRLSITPFLGPGGTRWAIPWVVVDCEREKAYGLAGIWHSANPSGALGPYQLLGWGAPFPADTPARRWAHHRIARTLYLREGLGPWTASRHCWG